MGKLGALQDVLDRFVDRCGFKSVVSKPRYGDLDIVFGLISTRGETTSKEFDPSEYTHECVETDVTINPTKALDDLIVKLIGLLPPNGSEIFWRHKPEILSQKDFDSHDIKYRGYARFSYKGVS